ncbi:MAG TPA: GldG family protein [Candidatus Polarisedimenticolia bacterium]|nr:GldG family protein [Candidatus Polarisedimenticolia bacterium]
MESLRRFGGIAGVLVALSGAGISWFVPDRRPYGWALAGAGVLLALIGVYLNAEDVRRMLKGRPVRHGANAVFYSLLVLGIVAAADFLAARHNHRIDLTPQGSHTLSPQSLRILESLDQDVQLVAFFSARMNPRDRQKAVDLLEEYGGRSGRVSARVLDPYRNRAETQAYGVEVDGTVIVSGKGGQSRVTPSFQQGLSEQELTNAIIKATSEEKKSVCVTTGHGERSIDAAADPRGFQQAAEALKKESFEVRTVRLLEGDQALAGCSSLVVPGPTHPMLPPEVQAIESYLAGGGRLLVLQEPRSPSGLEPLLERHGLKVGADFVVDYNPMGRLMGGSAAAPAVYDYGPHDITKDLSGLITIFPTVGSIEMVAASEQGVSTEALARTSEQSWGEMGELADRVSQDPEDKAGPLTVGAAATRTLDAAVPADPNASPEAEAPPAREARLVVFGDADYASSEFFMLGGNRDLFMNAIAWLNERGGLISVRPKPALGQPVVLTGMQGRIAWFYCLALFPLALAATGLGVYARRRRL